MLCYVVAYRDRVNIGIAKLNMLADLQFSEAAYGLGAGLFFIGYMLFEVPSNLIMHRVGARRWIARIMISWDLLSGVMAFVTTPLQFYTVRFPARRRRSRLLPRRNPLSDVLVSESPPR